MNNNLLKMHLMIHLLVKELSKKTNISEDTIHEITASNVEKLMKQKSEEDLLKLSEELEKIHLNNDFNVNNEE